MYETAEKYDLIIGNPPYFVMKKGDVAKEYYPYFEGRPNIFILFLVKSLGLLNNNGILSFVLPKNFLNCVYYDNMRKYLSAHFQILHIVDCANDKYMETQQETVIFVIKKQSAIDNEAFLLKIHQYTIFSQRENIVQLKELYRGSKSLSELGYKVSVGSVVWNQCKSILTNDASKTRLIYSSDITGNELSMKTYANAAKRNFIHRAGIKRPMLVINRGYGVGEYKFHYCLLDGSIEYLVENHLICIESNQAELSNEELVASYKKIIQSLQEKRTTDFIQLYFGNNAINTTELNYVLPIYV
jgi:adenine-specific DNA-methyltransferase